MDQISFKGVENARMRNSVLIGSRNIDVWPWLPSPCLARIVRSEKNGGGEGRGGLFEYLWRLESQK